MSRNFYDLTVFIGRFSPFHNGHQAVINKALSNSDHVLILIGSANRPRNPRSPFTFQERHDMIMAENAHFGNRVIVRPLNDHTYNDQMWMEEVQEKVNEVLRNELKNSLNPHIGLIGFNKDHTSYYLNMFPQWHGSINVEPIRHTNSSKFWNKGDIINSTEIRKALFETIDSDEESIVFQQLHGVMPYDCLSWVFDHINIIDDMREEHKFIEDYKKMWSIAPYPVSFQTTDAIVVQSGHVLLVERGGFPGKGLWAMPGGFLNPKEKLVDGMIRELREETKLKVPEPVLRGNIKDEETFDDPHRSLRGRTITRAFLIELPNGPLPKVKGSDDALKAFWVPLSDVTSDKMFEDHYDIIMTMINRRK